MWHLLLCLPLCLLLAPTYPQEPLVAVEKVITIDVQPAAWKGFAQGKLSPPIAALGVAGVAAVASAPPLPALPDPQTDPIAFLEACLKHYDATIHGYSLRFEKQERVNGKQQPFEVIDVYYRDHPYSVFFNWLQPANRTVKKALYVEGENLGADGKSLVKVITARGLIFDKVPNGPEAMGYSRYPMNTFGLRQAMQKVLDSWKRAKNANTLHLKYEGLKKTNLTGDAVVHVFHRTDYNPPEDDGIADLTIFIDSKTLLQIGSVVLDAQDKQLGTYFFHDIRINPTLAPDQFTVEALKR